MLTKKGLFFVILLGSIGSYYFFKATPEKSDVPIVAIAQIINHPSLDDVHKGLLQGLSDAGYEEGQSINIIYDNAHGNISVATQIADRFASLHPDVMVGLSTQTAQILMPLAQKEKIPLVFSAVTDPVSSKLVDSWDKTDEDVTGVSDYMPPEPQIELIKAFIPNIRKLGVLYNPSEMNSVSFLEKFEAAAQKENIELVYASVHNTAEAAEVLRSLVGRVDAIYFPNDNTVMAAADAVANAAIEAHIPLFANDEASVKKGVLAAISYDRIAMGRKTADMVAGLLRGHPTSSYRVHNQIPTEIIANGKTLQKLGMEMPSVFDEDTRII